MIRLNFREYKWAAGCPDWGREKVLTDLSFARTPAAAVSGGSPSVRRRRADDLRSKQNAKFKFSPSSAARPPQRMVSYDGPAGTIHRWLAASSGKFNRPSAPIRQRHRTPTVVTSAPQRRADRT
jgi:hypothetical protein